MYYYIFILSFLNCSPYLYLQGNRSVNIFTSNFLVQPKHDVKGINQCVLFGIQTAAIHSSLGSQWNVFWKKQFATLIVFSYV